MKVSGFTFIRNALKYDYPILESIQSILPLCDEFIVAVGKSEDQTRQLVESLQSPKIKIIDTIWDENQRQGGQTLAIETNKALAATSLESDWCFYLQADECVHEKYLAVIEESMHRWKDNKEVEGLLFNYLHFYGSYDYTGDSRRWYRKEIRIIRRNADISSYKDAQGFRRNGGKLNVKPVDAFIYHYGWVKPPEIQQAKQLYFNQLWHDEEWIKKNVAQVNEFNYAQIDSLSLFKDSHPSVMAKRIQERNWKFSFDPTQKKQSTLVRLLYFIEKNTGWKPGEYKNYKIIR